MRRGLVVVGSGPAGARAAQAYRDAGGPGPVTLVSADRREPYMRPPLSKDVLAGDSPPEPTPIDDADGAWRGIELVLGAHATGLDPARKTLSTTSAELSYDRLVVATGNLPAPLPNCDEHAQAHLLRSFDDAQALVAAAQRAATAVVVGSGFIGCEGAASLARRGLDVTLVTQEDAPQRDRLHEHASRAIADWLSDLGITVRAGRSIDRVDAPRAVRLDDGSALQPDLVLAALGVRPATDWLQSAGLRLRDGRVVVDAQMRTSIDGVYAAGDVAVAHNARAGRHIPVEHWGDAEVMGSIAGANAAGEQRVWDQPPGFWSTIGQRTLKYSAWGDGFDSVVVRSAGSPGDRAGDAPFAVWYGWRGATVGVLTYEDDEAYAQGQAAVAAGSPLPG